MFAGCVGANGDVRVLPAMVWAGGATPATAIASVATTARSELPLPVGNPSPREFPGRPTALLTAPRRCWFSLGSAQHGRTSGCGGRQC
jgi:hypothetical protein